MTDIWIVTQGQHEWKILGIFSTREKAEVFAKAEESRHDIQDAVDQMIFGVSIEKWTVDKDHD
jgi:hypothetical protein